MRVKEPKLLKQGDLVAMLGPASPMTDPKDVDKCIEAVEGFGFRVKAYPSARKKFDYLAGTDKQRAKDIHDAHANDAVKAVFCIRGGYGSSRLLQLLDWKSLAKNPKWLIGFSDITSLIGGFMSQSKMAALHAPTPSMFLKDPKNSKIAAEALKHFLFEGYKGLSYREFCGEQFKPVKVRGGKARGTLVGGNICLFAGLCGTPYMPKPKDAILFLEEVNEKPYKLDRYLTQLMNAGDMDNVRGVVLGHFTDCKPGAEDKDDALAVLSRCLKPLGIPVLAGFPAGHERPAYPLVMGAKVELDANKGDLRIG